MIRSASRVAELCHRPQSRASRFGRATVVQQRYASSFFKPSVSVRGVTAAPVLVDGGVNGSDGEVPCEQSAGQGHGTEGRGSHDDPARRTVATARSRETVVRVNIDACAADGTASNGVCSTGSTARVVGVSETATIGGGGGGDVSNRRYWAFDAAGKTRSERFSAEPDPPQTIETKVLRRVQAMLALVLPRGFPDSVSNPYRTYASWQFAAMAASAAAGVMSTQALLFAMGLGAGAIPLAATLNWVIKDGLGQLGGVAFTSFVNTRFDANPKLWRIVAAVSLDASMMLELFSPLAPAYFLPVASVANIGKNVSFLAASASRAAIHNVLSLKGNLADVTAKSGAQTIVACMVGTGAGVALSTLLGSEFEAIVPVCLVLSSAHLAANYMSVRRLGIPTFDSERLEIVTDAIIRAGGARQEMPTPQQVAARETLLSHAVRRKLGLDLCPTVAVGSRLEEAVRDWEELEVLCQACQGLPFLLAVRGDPARGTGEVHVLLLEGCETRGMLAGGYVALIAKHLLVERGMGRSSPPGRNRREEGSRPPLPRLGDDKAAPTGDILPDVIGEALRQGAALLAAHPPSPSAGMPEVRDKGGVDAPVGPNRREDGAGAGELGDAIAAELSARAERAGWNTSVLFLEKTGGVRLRLVRQA